MRVGVALLAAVLLAGCTGSSGSHHPSATPSSSTAASTGPAPLIPAAELQVVQAALTSADPTVVEPALAPALRPGYARHPVQLLPAGASIALDSAHATVEGDIATVPATVTGGAAPGRWNVLLLRINGQWFLYGTRR